MAPDITPAHRDRLDHLFDDDGVTLGVPSGLAGHYPHGSDHADLPIDWVSPFPVFTHPADATRLLVGVHAERGWTLVALDHITHHDCPNPVCGDVIDRRRRELAAIPAHAALFAACEIDTSWTPRPMTYLVHIDDYWATAAHGWAGALTEHTELSRW